MGLYVWRSQGYVIQPLRVPETRVTEAAAVRLAAKNMKPPNRGIIFR